MAASGKAALQPGQNGFRGLASEAFGRLVKQQNPRISEHHAGKRETALLAAGEAASALAEEESEAALVGHDRIERGDMKGLPQHVVGRFRAAELQVIHNRSTDQRRALRQVADDSRQIRLGPRLHGPPLDQNPPR